MFDNGPIEAAGWGKYLISGQVHGVDSDGNILGAGKDIILHGDQVSEWRERKGHLVTLEMLAPILSVNPDILVIGNGFDGKLTVPDELVSELVNERGMTVIVQKTPEACSIYNKIYDSGKKVAFAGHATC